MSEVAYRSTPVNPIARPAREAVTPEDADDWLEEIDAVLDECEQ